MYHYSMLAADGVGLVGVAGVIKDVKVTNAALREANVGWGAAATRPINYFRRRELTAALGFRATVVGSHVINRIVRRRLLDGAAAALGVVSSADGGILRELIVWVTEEK